MPFPKAPARMTRQPLLKERYVGIARRGHPALQKSRMQPKQWAALPHLLVSPRGEDSSESDEHLARLGLSRRVVMVVPHFLAAPLIVASSDLVTLLAERVARHFVKELDLAIFEPPVAMRGFTIDLLATAARTKDPALQWLRGEILQVCSNTHADIDAA